MYKSIVVPLDGSAFAEAAIPTALSIARDSYARVELVTVQTYVPTLDAARWEAAGREWAQQYLEDVKLRINEANRAIVYTSVVFGHRVPDAIAERAEEVHADLIVMSSHGLGPVSRLWLGSVTDQLVRQVTIPVLIVPADEDVKEPDLAAEVVFGKVLIPLDGSELSEAALAPASGIVTEAHPHYSLLRVVEPPPEYVSAYLPDMVRANEAYTAITDEWRGQAEEYVAEVPDRFAVNGAQVTGDVKVGRHPAREILDFAEDADVDLIAMSTHGRGGVTRAVLGSVTDKVLRSSDRPVLVFHPPEPKD